MKALFENFKAQLITLCLLVLSVAACHGHNSSHSSHHLKSYTLRPTTLHKVLYFNGSIQPLNESSMTNTLDGTIESMNFQYGQKLEKGQVIFTLNSPELQKSYNDILTEYLKAKDNYAIAKSKFVGTEDLWQSGLLAKNTYVSEKSSLNTSRLSLEQAARKLSELLEKTGENEYNHLSELKLEEFDKVRLALNSKHNLVHIKAPDSGVLLYPPKSNAESNSHFAVGSAVKAGQVLGLIGNLNGVRIDIDVPEVDINKIKPGMPAMIRCIAFPNDAIKAKLVAVNAQASSSSNGALPSFSAIIEAKNLSPSQKSWIKVGMSASVELNLDSPNKLVVPIAAVQQKQGQNLIQVKDKEGKLSMRPITTGSAQADTVVIDSGLQAGDVVVYG